MPAASHLKSSIENHRRTKYTHKSISMGVSAEPPAVSHFGERIVAGTWPIAWSSPRCSSSSGAELNLNKTCLKPFLIHLFNYLQPILIHLFNFLKPYARFNPWVKRIQPAYRPASTQGRPSTRTLVHSPDSRLSTVEVHCEYTRGVHTVRHWLVTMRGLRQCRVKAGELSAG